MAKSLIVSAVYIPPVNFRNASIDHFEERDNFLLDYPNEDYSHLLCGDFNSHIGIMLDYVTPDDDVEDDDNDLCEVHQILREMLGQGITKM